MAVRIEGHHDELARLEVSADEIARLADSELRTMIAAKLRELGFRYVTIDLEGFRSGSLLPLVMAAIPAQARTNSAWE